MIHDDFEWFCWVHMIYFEFWVIRIAVSRLIWTHLESWKSHELILSHENHRKSWTHKRLFPPCLWHNIIVASSYLPFLSIKMIILLILVCSYSHIMILKDISAKKNKCNFLISINITGWMVIEEETRGVNDL